MKIRDMMNTAPTTVGPDDSLRTLLCTQNDRQPRLLHVVDTDNTLLGVISSHDLLKLMIPFYLDANLAKAMPESSFSPRRAYEEHKHKTAAEIMPKHFHVIGPDDSFLEAETLIAEKGFNVLPVVDEDGRLLGEVGRREALSHVTEQCGCHGEDA